MKKCLPWQQSRYNSTGFSLLELSIVLLLIALLLMLTGAQINFIDRIVLRSELEQLYTTCSYIQRSAMMQNKPLKLIFDLHHNRYHYLNKEHTLAKQVQFGTALHIKGPPSKPTNPISHPCSFNNDSITFYPDGVIEPGAVYLTTMKKQYTYALSCAVSQVSYLRKYQYTDHHWVAV